VRITKIDHYLFPENDTATNTHSKIGRLVHSDLAGEESES
jgi:hypothetical protein